MQIRFDCPKCLQTSACDVQTSSAAVKCPACDWSRPIAAGHIVTDVPQRCLVCGCEDLWRQKDFPPAVGVLMVGLGIISSTIAAALMLPVWAMGILMGFALVDMLLFAIMRDALVCYRCHARYRKTGDLGQQPKFNLELNERYRQEAARLNSAGSTPASRSS